MVNNSLSAAIVSLYRPVQHLTGNQNYDMSLSLHNSVALPGAACQDNEVVKSNIILRQGLSCAARIDEITDMCRIYLH